MSDNQKQSEPRHSIAYAMYRGVPIAKMTGTMELALGRGYVLWDRKLSYMHSEDYAELEKLLKENDQNKIEAFVGTLKVVHMPHWQINDQTAIVAAKL